jgi:SAM-dependent methyltransferase
MTSPQPGVGTDVDAIWAPALARGLIRDEMLRSMRYCDGYTDLLSASGPALRRSLAQRAVDSAVVATICERVRRPIIAAAMRPRGLSTSEDRERAAAAVRFDGARRVLDVACGTGEFTSLVADRLRGDGFVIGLDNSASAMERAVRENGCARAVYMLGDVLGLPFDDGAFDLVCCIAALHFVPEPIGVLREMVRVLSPGGRIAVMTTYGREGFASRKGLELSAIICGVRVFDRTTVPAFFAAAGLTDVEQQLRGISQLVIARR